MMDGVVAHGRTTAIGDDWRKLNQKTKMNIFKNEGRRRNQGDQKGPAWNQKDVTKTGNEEGEVVDWVYEAGV